MVLMLLVTHQLLRGVCIDKWMDVKADGRPVLIWHTGRNEKSDF